jgi:hypothetical protein
MLSGPSSRIPISWFFGIYALLCFQRPDRFNAGGVNSAAFTPCDRSAELKIPLKSIGWDGDPAKSRGNLHSILGQGQERSYWSAFLPKAAKANFHQPQYFKPLLPCS